MTVPVRDGTVDAETYTAILHHQKVMNTALDLLQRFKDNDPFLNRACTSGAECVRRKGKLRQVQFLQVGEEKSNLELRIEVFVVSAER